MIIPGLNRVDDCLIFDWFYLNWSACTVALASALKFLRLSVYLVVLFLMDNEMSFMWVLLYLSHFSASSGWNQSSSELLFCSVPAFWQSDFSLKISLLLLFHFTYFRQPYLLLHFCEFWLFSSVVVLALDLIFMLVYKPLLSTFHLICSVALYCSYWLCFMGSNHSWNSLLSDDSFQLIYWWSTAIWNKIISSQLWSWQLLLQLLQNLRGRKPKKKVWKDDGDVIT